MPRGPLDLKGLGGEMAKLLRCFCNPRVSLRVRDGVSKPRVKKGPFICHNLLSPYYIVVLLVLHKD